MWNILSDDNLKLQGDGRNAKLEEVMDMLNIKMRHMEFCLSKLWNIDFKFATINLI